MSVEEFWTMVQRYKLPDEFARKAADHLFQIGSLTSPDYYQILDTLFSRSK